MIPHRSLSTRRRLPYTRAVHIRAICGSLQAKSSNLTLLHTAAAAAPEGVAISIFDGLRDLPHFNPDTEVGGEPPAVRAWRKALAESDALLIASPAFVRARRCRSPSRYRS